MNDSAPFILIAIAGTGIYLESQNKLLPALGIITSPSGNIATPAIGIWVISLIAYFGIMSMLPDAKDGFILTLVIVLGALLANHKLKGNADVIGTLLP